MYLYFTSTLHGCWGLKLQSFWFQIYSLLELYLTENNHREKKKLYWISSELWQHKSTKICQHVVMLYFNFTYFMKNVMSSSEPSKLNYSTLNSIVYKSLAYYLVYFSMFTCGFYRNFNTDLPFILHNKMWLLPFEYLVGKGDIAVNQYFLLFPQCFLFY